MAEALISIIIEQLAQVAKKNAVQKLRLVTGVEKEIEKLESNFKAIQCVLKEAEEEQVVQNSVKHWLERLKEVSYDMDDVLDEWNTAILKLEMNGVESVYLRKKVCPFISCFASSRQVVRQYDIASKIKKINEDVDEIAKKKDICKLATTEIRQPRRPESTAFVDVSKLHGRDKIKNKIVSTLLEGNENDIQTISILGMGGLGKTALAQLIFHDGEVQAYFNNVIWVCVSDFFDQNKIARAILEGLDPSSLTSLQNPISLHTVLVKICEKIKTAKFLLVLDDVWTDHDGDWEQLRAVFRQGMSGSRILVTTRKESVAIGMGSSPSQRFRLEELSDEVCWLILSQVAFVGWDDDLHENLEDIGKQIAKKCKGLPLAAKTLGGLLREKKTRNEWQNILNSEIWKLNVAQEYIFKPLLLSYYDLAAQIRPCLLYCAIFPKDFGIDPNELIKHWKAHDYLNSYENLEREEEKGEEYFKYLASRSFFQDIEKDWDGNIIGCKMHDMVHGFVQYLTNEEIVAMEIDGSENVKLNLSFKKAHHLRATIAEKGQFPVSIDSIDKLRSLVFTGKQRCDITGKVLQALFKEAKCLRLLDFVLDSVGFVSIAKEIPNEIGKLIHLKYLNLSYSKNLKKLPEGVCELYNLQYLNLRGCAGLEKLPDDIGKSINLSSLNTESCGSLKYYPKGTGRLISLKELPFVIARIDGNNFKEFSIGDLEELDHLRKYLEIRVVGKVADEKEAKRAKLHSKRHLEKLHIIYGRSEPEDFHGFIQALNPLPSLDIHLTDQSVFSLSE